MTKTEHDMLSEMISWLQERVEKLYDVPDNLDITDSKEIQRFIAQRDRDTIHLRVQLAYMKAERARA